MHMRPVKTDQTAQADLSLRWSHKSYSRFCRALAHMVKRHATAYMAQDTNTRLNTLCLS